MPRPVKCRKVCHFPQILEFLPADNTEKKTPIVLTVDEYETIRLLDKKGYSQEQCAASMQVARTTVQRIYEIARKKIADALIDGHPLRIEGGDFRICDGQSSNCSFGGCYKQEIYKKYAEEKGEGIMRIAVTYENGQIFQHFAMFSGAWYRWIILVAFIVVTSLYIIHYAEKVKKNPSKNLMGNEDSNLEDVDVSAIEVTGRHKLILLAVVIALAVLIYGVAYLGWFITEMATLFLVLGVVCGILAGFSGNKICDLYVQGMANITFGAMIVGVAGTINTVMVDGMIIDTIINALANAIVALPSSVKIIGMFLVQNIINLPINSGTGQAAATMPIMAPVGDLVGLTRQSTVLAFQLGDGLTNAIYPTSSTMLGFLAASKIPYSVWLKYVIKLVILLSLVSMAFLALAVVIGY